MLSALSNTLRFARNGVLAMAALGFALVMAHAASGPDRRVMLVVDASLSMDKAFVDASKFDALRHAVDGLEADWRDTGVSLGLVASGHRGNNFCGDVQTLVPQGNTNQRGLTDALNQITPTGRLAISDALIRGASEAGYSVRPVTLVLLGDGLDQCGRDPCKIAQQLYNTGIDFKVNVVAMNAVDPDSEQLRCIARETGGRYYDATDMASLEQSLKAAMQPPNPEKIVSDATNITEIILPALKPGTYKLIIRSPDEMDQTDATSTFIFKRETSSAGLKYQGRLNGNTSTDENIQLANLPTAERLSEHLEPARVQTPQIEITALRNLRPNQNFMVHWRGRGETGDRLMLSDASRPACSRPVQSFGLNAYMDLPSPDIEGQLYFQAPAISGQYEVQYCGSETGDIRARYGIRVSRFADEIEGAIAPPRAVSPRIAEIISPPSAIEPEIEIAGLQDNISTDTELEIDRDFAIRDYITRSQPERFEPIVTELNAVEPPVSEPLDQITAPKETQLASVPPSDVQYGDIEDADELSARVDSFAKTESLTRPRIATAPDPVLPNLWSSAGLRNRYSWYKTITTGNKETASRSVIESSTSIDTLPGQSHRYEQDLEPVVRRNGAQRDGGTEFGGRILPIKRNDEQREPRVAALDEEPDAAGTTEQNLTAPRRRVAMLPRAGQIRPVPKFTRLQAIKAAYSFTIAWQGTDSVKDWIAISGNDRLSEDYLSLHSSGILGSVQLRAPSKPGEYELRYISSVTGQVLSRMAFTVQPAIFDLVANESVESGDPVRVWWRGPGHLADSIELIALDQAEPRAIAQRSVMKGNPALFDAPAPGRYELRYINGSDGTILHRRALHVTERQDMPMHP